MYIKICARVGNIDKGNWNNEESHSVLEEEEETSWRFNGRFLQTEHPQLISLLFFFFLFKLVWYLKILSRAEIQWPNDKYVEKPA